MKNKDISCIFGLNVSDMKYITFVVPECEVNFELYWRGLRDMLATQLDIRTRISKHTDDEQRAQVVSIGGDKFLWNVSLVYPFTNWSQTACLKTQMTLRGEWLTALILLNT